jgi:hypothetical protein
VLPTFDGALWYRMRPHGDDVDSSLVDIWSLGRFPAGAAPVVQQEVFHGFEAFRGQCEFLEEDFGQHRGGEPRDEVARLPRRGAEPGAGGRGWRTSTPCSIASSAENDHAAAVA